MLLQTQTSCWVAQMGFLFGMSSYFSKYSLQGNCKASAKTYNQQFAQKLQSEEEQCENSSPRPAEGISITCLGERRLGTGIRTVY